MSGYEASAVRTREFVSNLSAIQFTAHSVTFIQVSSDKEYPVTLERMSTKASKRGP